MREYSEGVRDSYDHHVQYTLSVNGERTTGPGRMGLPIVD